MPVTWWCSHSSLCSRLCPWAAEVARLPLGAGRLMSCKVCGAAACGSRASRGWFVGSCFVGSHPQGRARHSSGLTSGGRRSLVTVQDANFHSQHAEALGQAAWGGGAICILQDGQNPTGALFCFPVFTFVVWPWVVHACCEEHGEQHAVGGAFLLHAGEVRSSLCP